MDLSGQMTLITRLTRTSWRVTCLFSPEEEASGQIYLGQAKTRSNAPVFVSKESSTCVSIIILSILTSLSRQSIIQKLQTLSHADILLYYRYNLPPHTL